MIEYSHCARQLTEQKEFIQNEEDKGWEGFLNKVKIEFNTQIPVEFPQEDLWGGAGSF